MADVVQIRPDNPYDKLVAGMPADQPEPSQGAIPATPANPYDQVLKSQDAAVLRGASLQTQAHSPDQYAEALKLSQEHGVPTGVALNNAEQLKTDAQRAEFDRTVAGSPTLSRWLQKPENMGVARDDVKNLAALEDHSRSFGDAALATSGALLSGFARGAASIPIGAGYVLSPIPLAMDFVNTLMSGKPTSEVTDAYVRAAIQPWVDRQRALELSPEAGLPEKLASATGSAASFLNQILLGGGGGAGPAVTAATTLPEMIQGAALHAIKATALPAVLEAINTGRQVMSDTGDPVQALKAAVAQYGATTVTGAIPVSFPGGIVKRVLTGALTGPVSSEAAKTISDVGLPENMRQPSKPDDLIVAAILGGVLGVAGPKAVTARDFHQRAASMDAAADSSKLRERSPEKFEDVVQAQLRAAGRETVFLPVEEFATYFQSQNVDPAEAWAKMTGDTKGYEEALVSGADLQVPYAKYLARMSPEERSALTPHLRATADAMTGAEAAKHEQDVQKLVTEQAPEAGKPENGEDVFRQANSDLMATGRFKKREAAANAAVVQAYYARRAERMGGGVKPIDLYHADLKGGIVGDRMVESGVQFAHGPRGGISFMAGGGARITLDKTADWSTFIHEFAGHLFLDNLVKDGTAKEADPQLVKDLDATLKHLGMKARAADGEAAIRAEMKRQHHELFATSAEAYFREGKSPSVELSGSFSRFRTWLGALYRDIKQLVAHGYTTPLSDEVRGVMDRLLASDEAIDTARKAAGDLLPIDEMRKLGMSEAKLKAYATSLESARNELTSKLLGDMVRKQTDAYRAELKAQGEKIERQTRADPVYNAIEVLAHNKRLDGDLPEALKGMKLNRAELLERYGDEFTKASGEDITDALKAHDIVASDKGQPLDDIAIKLGFEDADAMIRSIVEKSPREAFIASEAAKLVEAEHPDGLLDGTLESRAQEALHNNKRAQVIQSELELLGNLAEEEIPSREAIKEAAKRIIGDKRIRDVSPNHYLAAERRAADNAAKLAAKGKYAEALVEKRRQAVNAELYSEAQRFKQEEDKGLRYLDKFDRPGRENIAAEFRDQIDSLLDRFDLRKSMTPEQAQAAAKVSLESFVEKLGAMKFNLDIPERFITALERVHFRDLSVGDFRGLVSSVKQLDKMGRSILSVQDGEQSRLLEEVALEAVTQAAGAPPRNNETNRGLSLVESKWLGFKSFGRSIVASMLKAEQMCDWLDNYKVGGVFNRMVFRKIADAEGVRNDLDLKIAKQWESYVKALPKELLKNSRKTVEVPGLVDGLTGRTQKLTWGEKIMLAGIRGDAGHFAKLLKGEDWDPAAVTDFLDKNMTKQEWDFVHGISKTFEEVFHVKNKMLSDMGSSPAKAVDRIAFQTAHGEYPGWYWPVSYDPARSQSVKERAARHGDSIFEDNIYSRADTSTGREQTRSESYAKPMLLSIDALPRILKDEIRDATTRRAIVEADRFLSHPAVRDAVSRVLSPQHYDQFNGWLLSLANDAVVKPNELQMWDRLAHTIRSRVTIVGLGFRLSTMVQHGMTAAGESIAEAGPKAMLAGAFNTKTLAALSHIGPEWLQKGLDSFMRSDQWIENKNFIIDRSAEMRHRSQEVERDVREKLQSIQLQLMDPATGAIKRAKLAIESRAYSGIAMLDMASALPTWMGAYLKGLEKTDRGGMGLSEQDAAYFADKSVRNAHGGGGIKDLAAVQRGSEFFKLFTMFYTFWNHNFNRIVDTGRRIGKVATGEASMGDVGTLLMRTFMYTLGVQAIHHLLHPPKDDGEPETWLKWFGKTMAQSLLGGVPIMRDIASHFAGGKDYEMSPIAAAVNNTDRMLKDAEGQSRTNRFITHALVEAGYIFGLPTGQAASTVQFLGDVWDGKQNPQDVTDWWNGILHGDMKHQ